MTKSELDKKTKAELIRLAKRKFDLSLKDSLKKDEMISLITKAVRKISHTAAKKTKPAAKAKSVKQQAKKPASAAKGSLRPGGPATAKPTGMTARPKAAVKKTAARPASAAKGQLRPGGPKRAAKPVIKPIPAESAKRREIPTVATPPRVHTGEERVQDSKYYVAPVQEHLHPTYEPPRSYEDDKITALARDPFYIFSFWDLHPDTRGRVARANGVDAGSCDVVLRVYDVTAVDFNGGNAVNHFDITVGLLEGSWYINVPKDGRDYCVEIGLRDQHGTFYAMARSNVVSVPRAGVSDRVDEEWMIADEEFWKLYGLSGGFGPIGSSEELAKAMQARLRGEVGSGGVSSFGASEQLAKRKNDDFWFRLDCELIVYGATEPGAEVTLGGEPVTLRPDGTFTKRFAMPDGLQVLQAKAVSANRKHEKSITPTLSRSTTSFEDINREAEEL